MPGERAPAAGGGRAVDRGGFLASWLFLKAQLGYMLPLLNRITGPETARNE
jgi:hypothetical protein